MTVDLLLGLQWGDEGKGKIVDVLTSKYDIIARFQGGPNAGHTLEFDGIKHVLRTIPSGIFHSNNINIIDTRQSCLFNSFTHCFINIRFMCFHGEGRDNASKLLMYFILGIYNIGQNSSV
jgi:hypothetical protein